MLQLTRRSEMEAFPFLLIDTHELWNIQTQLFSQNIITLSLLLLLLRLLVGHLGSLRVARWGNVTLSFKRIHLSFAI